MKRSIETKPRKVVSLTQYVRLHNQFGKPPKKGTTLIGASGTEWLVVPSTVEPTAHAWRPNDGDPAVVVVKIAQGNSDQSCFVVGDIVCFPWPSNFAGIVVND